MKAAPEQQKKLLELQEFDTALARLTRREEQLPQIEQLANVQTEYASRREHVMNAQHALEDAQLEMKRLEDDLAVVKQRFHRDEEKLNQSTSGKEAEALEHELQTLNARSAQLEEQEFELVQTIEEKQAALDEQLGELDALEGRRRALTAELEREREEIAQSRLALDRKRAELCSLLAPELIELYEATRQRYGIGAAMLRGKVSEGSNMALTDSDLAELRETAPDEVVFCRDSGCILVRTEESAL